MADDELKTGTGTSKDPKRLHEPVRERARPFSWEGEGARAPQNQRAGLVF